MATDFWVKFTAYTVLLIQLCWLVIIHRLWHRLADADDAGIEKYLQIYVIFYLLSFTVTFICDKLPPDAKTFNSKWWTLAFFILLWNVFFVWYTYGIHDRVENILKYRKGHDDEKNKKIEVCDKP